MIWENKEVSRIIYNGEPVLEKDGAITAEEILGAARKAAVKKFVVKDINGSELSPTDFPRVGTFLITAYNEAA